MHPDTNQSNAEILQILRKAGFPPLTPVQERLAPLFFKGRDAVVESAHASEPVSGFVLPIILGLRSAGLAPRALLLLPDRQDVEKISQAVSRFMRIVKDAPLFVPLGETEDVRREQRRLEKGATVVAGTTERVIDHIRRGSLNISALEAVVVQEPDGETRADFIKDVQFIFARLSGRHQTILLNAPQGRQESELLDLLHHPVVVTEASQPASTSAERENLYFEVSLGDKVPQLARILLGRKVISALVLCPARTDPQKLTQALRAQQLRAVAWPGPLGGAVGQRLRSPRGGVEKASIQASLSRGEADVVVGSSLPEGFSPSHVVYMDIPSGIRPVRWTSSLIVLVDRIQEKEISRLQEAVGVALKKEEFPTDTDVVVGLIDRVLRNMKDDKEGMPLAQLRSLIRRQVPFLKRQLFMAYLLKSMLPPSTGASQVARPLSTAGRALASRETPERASRGRFGRSVEVPRPAGEPQQSKEFTQLFVSIGRNRRVFARELAELFTEKLQLSANELGSVRVFDKYSFVDINPARADEAITRLSGSEVRGRTITVNYAKKKEVKGNH